MKKIRIGCGAGYAGDRLDPALELIAKGNLDYICFEGLAERTIALAQQEKKSNLKLGYNDLLLYRMEKVLPLAYKHRTKVITNMGAANPLEAIKEIGKLAVSLDLHNIKIAAVIGDDCSDKIEDYLQCPILETGALLSSLKEHILSANAYLGGDGIVEALANGADIVITGRVADPSLFLAPMQYEFGWEHSQTKLMGTGTLIGHLLECAGQVTGGYFADPGKKEVPDLWDLGFPFVEVYEDGNGFISKLQDAGGLVTPATCTEQLLYEIHDPANYITPDCTADFSKVMFYQDDKDKVVFKDANSKTATDTYKVSVAYSNGFLGEGEISYGGANCLERGLLAKKIMAKRLKLLPFEILDMRIDLIGVDALIKRSNYSSEPSEVRLRVAGKTPLRNQAQQLANEVEALYTNGPAGGGGATKKVSEVVAIASILVPKSDIDLSVTYITT
ncbi:acyclic terpene utilization AtuA family protein [Maribacter sp. X9]|uniref:acyclic terpene utilization AtuA family protein n=1 Tax=Maribacter sp. X9 TaxID=3402159 RepID=UPI003AF37641